jgi:chromosome partitioning protein
MKTIAVANQKGGVGKTATVVNLGAALAQRDLQILLIDGDPQANTTGTVGADERPGHGVYDLMMDEGVRCEDVIVETGHDGLDLIPSDIGLAGGEVELASASRKNERIARKLDVDLRYDFVLIDTPPSLGFLTINALSAADYVLIPVQASYLAMQGLKRLLDTVDAVTDHSNADLQILGMVLTMYDRRTVHASEVEERLREHFGDLVFETVIYRSVDFDYATVAGEPLVVHDTRSRGSVGYRKLAQEVIDRAED